MLQGMPHQVAELVRDGKVTIGITHLPPEIPNELISVPFLTSQRVLVTPVGHPILKESELTLQKLSAYPVIIEGSWYIRQPSMRLEYASKFYHYLDRPSFVQRRYFQQFDYRNDVNVMSCLNDVLR